MATHKDHTIIKSQNVHIVYPKNLNGKTNIPMALLNLYFSSYFAILQFSMALWSMYIHFAGIYYNIPFTI